jgi:hypothetical protein
MNTTHQADQHLAADPAYRKLQRAILALCVLLAPFALSLWFGLCPPFGDVSCPSQGMATLDAFRTMNPGLLKVFLALSVVIPYTYPLSYVGLGLLAMKRAPWLATLGIAFGLAGSIPWGSIAGGQIGLADTMAHLAPNPVFVTIEHRLSVNPVVFSLATGWVIGHLAGYLLLGIALARARAVPRWAAWLIAAATVIMGPIAYGTKLGVLQVIGYALVFLGSVPAALALLTPRPPSQAPEILPAAPLARRPP